MRPIYIYHKNKENQSSFYQILVDVIDENHLSVGAIYLIDQLKQIIDHRQSCNPSGIYFLDYCLGNSLLDKRHLVQTIRFKDPYACLIFIKRRQDKAYETEQYQLQPFGYLTEDDPQLFKQQLKACLCAIEQRHAKEVEEQVKYTIKVDQRKIHVPKDESYFIETSERAHYLRLHTKDQHYEFRGKLSEISKTMGSDFLLIHRSYLVNAAYIREIDYQQAIVTLANGQKCLISKRGKRVLTHAFHHRNECSIVE